MTTKKSATPVEEEDTSRDPVESTWRGQPIYSCPIEGCQFDNGSKEITQDHINVMHPISDEFGNAVSPPVPVGDPTDELLANEAELQASMAPSAPATPAAEEEKSADDKKSKS